eukprot:TRINITY_DN19738_c0_g1_i1.p1 TRINITY_DN19738_c0_g1~~TRINITY_DN19738_c0_g1_i1.p1  ORF type:complete len:852 (+),score=146.98 TRINITY_DN19738_c0_g1_i1:35-2590(+)
MEAALSDGDVKHAVEQLRGIVRVHNADDRVSLRYYYWMACVLAPLLPPDVTRIAYRGHIEYNCLVRTLLQSVVGCPSVTSDVVNKCREKLLWCHEKILSSKYMQYDPLLDYETLLKKGNSTAEFNFGKADFFSDDDEPKRLNRRCTGTARRATRRSIFSTKRLKDLMAMSHRRSAPVVLRRESAKKRKTVWEEGASVALKLMMKKEVLSRNDLSREAQEARTHLEKHFHAAAPLTWRCSEGCKIATARGTSESPVATLASKKLDVYLTAWWYEVVSSGMKKFSFGVGTQALLDCTDPHNCKQACCIKAEGMVLHSGNREATAPPLEDDDKILATYDGAAKRVTFVLHRNGAQHFRHVFDVAGLFQVSRHVYPYVSFEDTTSAVRIRSCSQSAIGNVKQQPPKDISLDFVISDLQVTKDSEASSSPVAEVATVAEVAVVAKVATVAGVSTVAEAAEVSNTEQPITDKCRNLNNEVRKIQRCTIEIPAAEHEKVALDPIILDMLLNRAVKKLLCLTGMTCVLLCVRRFQVRDVEKKEACLREAVNNCEQEGRDRACVQYTEALARCVMMQAVENAFEWMPRHPKVEILLVSAQKFVKYICDLVAKEEMKRKAVVHQEECCRKSILNYWDAGREYSEIQQMHRLWNQRQKLEQCKQLERRGTRVKAWWRVKEPQCSEGPPEGVAGCGLREQAQVEEVVDAEEMCYVFRQESSEDLSASLAIGGVAIGTPKNTHDSEKRKSELAFNYRVGFSKRLHTQQCFPTHDLDLSGCFKHFKQIVMPCSEPPPRIKTPELQDHKPSHRSSVSAVLGTNIVSEFNHFPLRNVKLRVREHPKLTPVAIRFPPKPLKAFTTSEI